MNGLGPTGPRAVIARPTADVDPYGGFAAWFKDCSAPGAADGTVPTASFFNAWLGNMRYAASQAGVDLASNTNDQYLWQIMQAASGPGGGSAATAVLI